MATDVKTQLDAIFKRINDSIGEAAKASTLEPLASFAIETIALRTRLGYGVNKQFGEKENLKGLTSKYVLQRKRSRFLSDLTAPKKSNLTFTGQLINSLAIISSKDGKVVIGPTGRRKEGNVTNAEVASYQADQGRVFNKLSEAEYLQLLRFYRRTFGDLLRKKKLIK